VERAAVGEFGDEGERFWSGGSHRCLDFKRKWWGWRIWMYGMF
jgi:hypothetical protein